MGLPGLSTLSPDFPQGEAGRNGAPGEKGPNGLPVSVWASLGGGGSGTGAFCASPSGSLCRGSPALGVLCHGLTARTSDVRRASPDEQGPRARRENW